MPLSKDRLSYLVWIKEKKRFGSKSDAEKSLSLRKCGWPDALAGVLQNRFWVFLFVCLTAGALLLWWIPSKHSASSGSQSFFPARTGPQANESLTPPARAARQHAKFTPLSPDEIVGRAKKAVFLLKTSKGKGTGFLLSSDGIVVAHTGIIGLNQEAEVLVPSQGEKKGVVLKKLTAPLDLAFLKIEGGEFEPGPPPYSDLCQEGEEILALSFPPGGNAAEPLATTGVIRNCNRLHQGLRYFQFDPEVAQAGMGAPLFNFKGEVIGILQGRLALPGQEEISVGLPIQTVRAVMEDKLVHLEEKVKEREKFYKYIYDDLWVVASNEYQAYQKKLALLNEGGKLSTEEAYRLEKTALTPPSGFPSLKAWIGDLGERVLKEEVTKEKATHLIRAHFTLSSQEKNL